jgi:sugar O-acyltransferase (sialic acid O-acetyltransferase NeuD family)
LKSLVIIGAGGHGSAVADAAACAAGWSEITFYDDRWPGLRDNTGHPVAGPVAALRSRVSGGWPPNLQLIIAIGDNRARMALTQEFLALGATLATVVHPTAVISRSSTIGPGTVICARAVINPRSRVGVSCIINTGAVIEHDVAIADGTHICPAAALAGQVTVESLVTIGIGACVIPGTKIGRGAIVGAGAAVICDVEPGSTVVGTPARKIEACR